MDFSCHHYLFLTSRGKSKLLYFYLSPIENLFVLPSEKGSANCFCQEPDSKYFNPCRPYTWSLSQLLTSVAWTVHDPAKLCATKTAWMGADLALGLEFATPALID